MMRLCVVGLCVMCLTCVGCGSGGPEVGKVSGKVTMDGEPLDNALVTFTPVDGGRPSTGKTDENGNYTLAYADRMGALVGKHQVRVTTLTEVEGEDMSEIGSDSEAYMKQATGGSASDYDNATVSEPIPAKYNTETELTRDVESGKNTIDIELSSN
ncbi:MAG: carboxypeptidase-like regulatory domain-containing protein [Planctomycetota bacterium]